MPSLEDILTSWEGGALSSSFALMEMLVATRDRGEEVKRFLAASAKKAHDARYDGLLQMLTDNAEGCARVAGIVRDTPILRDVSDVSALFDRAVRASEEASVALYSLGNPSILEQATLEIVSFLEQQGWLGRRRKLLDLGSGIGRFEVAIASRVASVVGLDVSPEMISVAERRAIGLANVRFVLGNGLELPFRNGEFDVVLAIDTMPYIVGLGDDVLESTFREVARVLRAGGHFAILELSYREDLEADRRDLATFAARFGFDVVVDGPSPFALWSGTAFSLRRLG